MELSATVTSKGQVTIPKEVRDALGLEIGDRLFFRVHGGGALVTKANDFIELAGSLPVPPELRGKPWTEIREETWRRVARDEVRRSKRS